MAKSETKQVEASGHLWNRIADDLVAAVTRGEYLPGAVLPAATELAERYGVNRHTARQALLHLQSLGLVTVERGRGTTVVGDRLPYRIGRKVSLRTNIAPTGREVSAEVLGACRRVATGAESDILGLAREAPVWEVRTFTRTAGIALSTGLHVLSCERFADFPDVLTAAGASISAAFKHYGIGDYIRLETRLSADVATPPDAAMLEIEPGEPVMRSRAVDGLPDRTPLQMSDGTFAGRRVEMVVEIGD